MPAAGCRQDKRNDPPPDARRPALKSEAELSAQRQARIEAGTVTPAPSPAIRSSRTPAEGQGGAEAGAPGTPSQPRQPLVRGPGAIEADILMVDEHVLTVGEVLYPLYEELVALRAERAPAAFRDEARQRIQRQTQREIGSLLVYGQAFAQLDDGQRDRFNAVLDARIEDIRARQFEGSKARLSTHLKDRGLTLEQFRQMLAREMIVRQYTREKLMPQVQIVRSELLAYYRENKARYETAETRELYLIELLFEKYLPEGRRWEHAGEAEREQARLTAAQRARDAHDALAARPFEDVAREYSVGVYAASGGRFGEIGRPLLAPLDQVTAPIFSFEEGQYTEPIETQRGWYIARCGRITPAVKRSFAEVQPELREELMNRRFNELSIEYVMRLADRATISSVDGFVDAALQQSERLIAPASSNAAARGEQPSSE